MKYDHKQISVASVTVSAFWTANATGNYGNQVDGVSKSSTAKKRKKDGENEDEENELIQNSSEDEAEEDSNITSVSSTPPMKPFITDRSEVTVSHKTQIS